MGKEKPKYFVMSPLTYYESREQRALRRKVGKGAELDYVRLMHEAVKTEGYIEFKGTEESIEAEIAYDILKEETRPEDVVKMLDAAQKIGLVERLEDGSIYIPECITLTTKEAASTERTRKWRAKQKAGEDESSQCDGDASQCDGDASQNGGNKDKDKIRTKTELNLYKEIDLNSDFGSSEDSEGSAGQLAGAAGAARAAGSPDLMGIEELTRLQEENPLKAKPNLNAAGIKAFHDDMARRGWRWGKNNEQVRKSDVLKVMRSWMNTKREKHREYFEGCPTDKKSESLNDRRKYPAWFDENKDYKEVYSDDQLAEMKNRIFQASHHALSDKELEEIKIKAKCKVNNCLDEEGNIRDCPDANVFEVRRLALSYFRALAYLGKVGEGDFNDDEKRMMCAVFDIDVLGLYLERDYPWRDMCENRS